MKSPKISDENLHRAIINANIFQKRSSLISLSAETASELGYIASALAEGEGLHAHSQSAKYRIIKKNE